MSPTPPHFKSLSLTVAAALGAALPGLGAISLFEETFESYANDTELQDAWSTSTLGSVGSPVATLEGGIVQEGLQSMQLDYDMPTIGATLDTVAYEFETPQDFSQGTVVRFYYRGTAGNSNESIFFELLDGVGASLGNAIITSGTLVESWNEAIVDLSGFAGDLTTVDTMVLGVLENPVALGGSGTVYFDALAVEGVPEPGAPVLLGLACGLACTRRRR